MAFITLSLWNDGGKQQQNGSQPSPFYSACLITHSRLGGLLKFCYRKAA